MTLIEQKRKEIEKDKFNLKIIKYGIQLQLNPKQFKLFYKIISKLKRQKT